MEEEILSSLHRLECANLPGSTSKFEIIVFFLAHPTNSLDFCSNYLWRILYSIFESSETNSTFLKQLLTMPHFNKFNLLNKLLAMPRRHLSFKSLYKIVKYEASRKSEDAVGLLITLFEHLPRNDKVNLMDKWINANDRERDVFEYASPQIEDSLRDRFMNQNVGNDETLQILEDFLLFVDTEECALLMLERLDHLRNVDAKFVANYSMSLVNFTFSFRGKFLSKDDWIVDPIVQNLDIELSKEYPEYEKLSIAFDLLFNIVKPDAFDRKAFRYKLQPVLNKMKKDQISDPKIVPKMKAHISDFRQNYLRSCGFSRKKRLVGEYKATEMLKLNSDISFGKWSSELARLSSPYECIAKIMELANHADSSYRKTLHAELLDYFMQFIKLNSSGIPRLSQILNNCSYDNLEVLKNWIEVSETFENLKIIAHFILHQSSEKLPEVISDFLIKINNLLLLDSDQIRELIIYLRPMRSFDPATKLFVKSRKTIKMLRDCAELRFFEILKVFARFLRRDEFVECLLSRIELLDSENRTIRLRYAWTLAKCGYDIENRYQIDFAENWVNAKIVRHILKFLRNESTCIEVSVQIFKNFVKMYDDPGFYMNHKIVAPILADFAQNDENLKDKIDDLFITNLKNNTEPSFGSEVRVVAEEEVRIFAESE